MEEIVSNADDGGDPRTPLFDEFQRTERARSRRVLLVIALLVGPALVVGFLGDPDTGFQVFGVSFALGIGMIYVITKLDRFDVVDEEKGTAGAIGILVLYGLYQVLRRFL